MGYTRYRVLQRAGCTLVISTAYLGGCADYPVDAPSANIRTGVVAGGEVHNEDHHGHEHHHHHHHECTPDASQFGGLTVCVGDVNETELPPAYAEVVVSQSHEISIYLRTTQREESQTQERIDDDTLDIVTAWVDDAKVFRSTIATLQAERYEKTDHSGGRRYVGQLSEKYRDGGDILLLAPIVRINGDRESFDLIATVPPLLDQAVQNESNSSDLRSIVKATPDSVQSRAPETNVPETHHHD